MSDAILVLNAGSSSIKFSLFEGHGQPGRQGLISDGECEGIGHRVHFTAKDRAGASLAEHDLIEGATHEDALAALLRWLETRFRDERLIAAGHRVVHGGSLYTAPVRIDASVIADPGARCSSFSFARHRRSAFSSTRNHCTPSLARLVPLCRAGAAQRQIEIGVRQRTQTETRTASPRLPPVTREKAMPEAETFKNVSNGERQPFRSRDHVDSRPDPGACARRRKKTTGAPERTDARPGAGTQGGCRRAGA